jgi:phosphosulfolactate synthase
MLDSHWRDIAVIKELRGQRTAAPRSAGMTMIIDTGLGVSGTADVLEAAGDYIDLWKLSFGTSIFVRPAVLERKLELIKSRGILVCPGGTLFEAAILQQPARQYCARAVEVGFTGIEISDGTIELPAFRRKRVIDAALEAGLVVITEVGKKDPKAQPPLEKLAEQALRDMEWGARWVIVEGRESGTGVGVYDDEGGVDMAGLDTFARILAAKADCLIWEAPLKHQQTALIERFGVNVGLGNVDPQRVLALEALRLGLRFETLKPLADKLRRTGQWAAEQIEAVVIGDAIDGRRSLSRPPHAHHGPADPGTLKARDGGH